MGFPGRGGSRGGRGGGGRGGRGGGRGGRGGFGGKRFDEGPPASVEEVGVFMHAAENDAVVNCTHEKIPMFNAGIYLEDGKTKVGKIEEIW